MNYPSVQLENVCSFLAGNAWKSEGFTSDSSGIPVIRIQNVSDNVGDFVYWLSDYDPKYIINDGDILLSLSGNVKLTIWKSGRGLLNQRVVKLIPNQKIDQGYFYWAIDRAIEAIAKMAKHAVIANVSMADLRNIEIPLPPLDEQRRIAAILDKAAAIRRKRQESIRLTEEFLRSTFLEMFGDPATNPKGWGRKELGEILFIDSPMIDPQLGEYLDLLHIGPDRIEKGTGRILPALTAREDKLISGKFLFDERHVLYSKIRPLLRKAALPNFRGLCSADMYPIRPSSEFTNREFLWSILLSDAFTDFTQTISSRANIPKINRTELASYKCIMPPLELQNEYAKILGKNTLVGKKLTLSTGYIDDLFAGLTHRAFRGEL